MNNSVQQCLNLIIWDNVDEVLWALNDTYFWFIKLRFSDEAYKQHNILQRFLDQVSVNLASKERQRQVISDKDTTLTFRSREVISQIIQPFLETRTPEDGIDFLGKLTAAYALEVPEPLFRSSESFLGLHQTPDQPPIDDHLPMTDKMILFAWQHFWFYSWLGY